MSEYLKPRMYIKINDEFYRITTHEPLIYDTAEDTVYSAVADGGESTFKDIEKIEPRETPRELYQVRFGVEDGCDYYVKYPSGTERFGVNLKKDVGKISALDSHRLAMNEDYEMWLVHTDYPSINAKNNTGASVTPKVWFKGMKYNYEEVKDEKVLADLNAEKIPYKTIIRGGVFV